jgi:hypothetical protein
MSACEAAASTGGLPALLPFAALSADVSAPDAGVGPACDPSFAGFLVATLARAAAASTGGFPALLLLATADALEAGSGVATVCAGATLGLLKASNITGGANAVQIEKNFGMSVSWAKGVDVR